MGTLRKSRVRKQQEESRNSALAERSTEKATAQPVVKKPVPEPKAEAKPKPKAKPEVKKTGVVKKAAKAVKDAFTTEKK